MAIGKQLARLFDFEIGDGASGFLQIAGITSFSPSTEKNDADLTTFDSEGWLEHFVASRGLSFEVEGYHIEDEATGDRDPGQERVEEVGRLVGNGSVVPFQMTSPGGTVVSMQVSADTSMFGQSTGGGNDDPAGWSCTLTVSGKPTVV